MKKSLILVPIFAAIAACGSSGEKGPALARIDGDTFTQGDLDLRLNAYDDARREQILKNPDLRRDEFSNILRLRLYSLAGQKSPYGKSEALRQRLASLDQRVATQYYFETHLSANAGLTQRELEEYYQANSARFKDDSGVVQPLWKVQNFIVDTLVARKADLDSFYNANKTAYKVRAEVQPALIRTRTRKEADAALKALKGGASFATVAARYSDLSSKDKGGAADRVSEGGQQYDLGQELSDSLFFGPKRLAPGRHSGVVSHANAFFIVSVTAYTPESTPALSAVRARVLADYMREYKARIQNDVIARLKEKHKVRAVSRERAATDAEVRKFYEENKENYESPETFELYHVEAADEAKLKAAVAKVKDLAQFKALAAGQSENALTKAREGYLGVVKRDFSLPYGIGTMPSLFPELDAIQSGKLPGLVQNPQTQTWHAFWLVKKAPRQLKPLDRVQGLVREDLKANRIDNIAPGDSLVVIGATGHVIREKDVLFLRQEIPPQMQERYTRENLLEYLTIWRIVSDEAKLIGLDTERKLRAMRLQNEDGFWERVYVDSVLSRTWGEDASVLSKTFNANKAVFGASMENDWKPFARDVAAFLRLTPKDMDLEYRTNPDRYKRDTTEMSFSEARPMIFQALKPEAYARLDAKILDGLKKRFKVKIVDASLNEPSLEPVSATFKKAQDLHYDRKLEDAAKLYGKLRDAYPDRAGLQDSVSFGLAQIYIEQERYAQAMAEYRRVSYLYPNSPNDYKAMFMVGFIYAEHLKQDSAAVRAFEAMLKKHPKSDLADDADWMVRNIRSGGQLMPQIEDEESPAARKEEAPAN